MSVVVVYHHHHLLFYCTVVYRYYRYCMIKVVAMQYTVDGETTVRH